VKRSAPIVAVVLLLIALIAAFVPYPGCPDCLADQPDVVDNDCARCGDTGRVSAFGRVRRRPIDRDLTLLIGEPSFARGEDLFTPTMRRLLDRSRRSIDVPETWVGCAVFVPDGGRRVLARLGPSLRPSGPVADVVVLFESDGAVLDLVQVSSAEGENDLDARRDGAVVRIDAPPEVRPHRFAVVRGSERSIVPGVALTVRASGDRLDVDVR
jgi:hypothetical protein